MDESFLSAVGAFLNTPDQFTTCVALKITTVLNSTVFGGPFVLKFTLNISTIYYCFFFCKPCPLLTQCNDYLVAKHITSSR